jgi:hypothetical protein
MPRRPRRRRASWYKGRPVLTAVGVCAVAIASAALLSWLLLFRSSAGSQPPGPPTAAIVDQLSFNVPNPDFAQQTTALLEQAGYKVDYYPSEQVNVDFYRRLSEHGYKVIIFRSHADRLQAEWHGKPIDEVILFTSEPYDRSKYVSDQAANRLVIAQYAKGGDEYFGIAPDFFNKTIGNFKGTTIVMMGCEGLLSTRTAAAFVDLGAKTYISWDASVTAPHTDAATEALLQHLLIEKRSASDAVALTMADVGPDPVYGSRLEAYPPGG